MKRKPTNTEQQHKDDPTIALFEMLMMGTSDMITNQESQGQTSFVNSDTLPSTIDDVSLQALTRAGVKFGDLVEGDDLFQYVELPDGWEKKPSDHPMWSYLVDSEGRKRASIFYKAAFYDRKAHVHATCRFSYGLDYSDNYEEVAVAHVRDCDKVIFTSDKIDINYPSKEAFDTQGLVSSQAQEWLNNHYPDWNNPSAYWD